MRALHFGAGYFGLGFACALLSEAGVPVTLLNRKTEEQKKDELDTISRVRRNELLNEHEFYFVSHKDMTDPSASDLQQVVLDGVLLYDARNADEIAEMLAEYDDDLIVTFALRRIDNYQIALRMVARIHQRRIERNCRSSIFFIACENGVETSRVAQEFAKLKQGGASTRHTDQLIFVQTCVDRICTRLDTMHLNAIEYLVVEAEKHARWYIEDRAGIDALKDALNQIQDKIVYTQCIAQERLKKLAVLNGAHALLALHCWYLGIEKTDEFLNGTVFRDKAGTLVSLEFVERRRTFLSQIISELFEGIRLFLSRDEYGRSFCQRYMSDDQKSQFTVETVDRLARTPDSVARIIKNFIRPEPADRIQERHLEFFRSVRARIEEPVLAYIESNQVGPPVVCRVLVEILDLLGRVDQFKTMPLFKAEEWVH